MKSIAKDTRLIVKGGGYRDGPDFEGVELKQWRALREFMIEHPDRKKYSVSKCCRESFVQEEGGFSSWNVLNVYAGRFRDFLPL